MSFNVRSQCFNCLSIRDSTVKPGDRTALNEFLGGVNHDRSEAEMDEAKAKRRTAVLLRERAKG